jgi:hypothetical protein
MEYSCKVIVWRRQYFFKSEGLEDSPCTRCSALKTLVRKKDGTIMASSSEELKNNDSDNLTPEGNLDVNKANLTANPGDRISEEPQSTEEKAKQVAVDSPDITGDHIKVPTYFVVEEPDGEEKALHHVKDAEEISDVIRKARVDEDGNRLW